MTQRGFALRRIAAPVLLFALCGCAVGPDYARPEGPAASTYTAQTLPLQTVGTAIPGGAPQRFDTNRDIPAQWWEVFQSRPLNGLIEQALLANPSLPAAEAALRQAQENVAAQRGSYYLAVSVNASPTRQKTAGVLSSPTATGDSVYNLHTAQVNVSYTVDAFGLNRRQVEALQSQADYQRYQFEAARLSLTSNVVLAVVQVASLRGQISATESTIGILNEQLGILRRQVELGAIAESNVVAQEATLAQTEATLPGLRKQLAQQQDLLAMLTGRSPNEMEAVSIELGALHLPETLPMTLPSALARQRPDIRSAEAQLHAASAQVGVAVANMFPQVTLTAGQGSSALRVADLFTSGSGFWSLAGSITQPLFQGGTLLHRRRAAEAAYEQALYQYRGTVLSALQNVADVLHALVFDAEALAASDRAERAALASLDIARRQVELGDVSYLALLTSEQAYQQARLATVQAQANRYADTAALFQALGGGWRHGAEENAVARAQP